jgi:hypothetical protein
VKKFKLFAEFLDLDLVKSNKLTVFFFIKENVSATTTTGESAKAFDTISC